MTESKKIAKAILSGLSKEEQITLAKIIIADDEAVMKEFGHGKEETVKAFAKVALKRINKEID